MDAGRRAGLDVPGVAHRVLERLQFIDRLGPDKGLGQDDAFLLEEDGETVDQRGQRAVRERDARTRWLR